MRGWAAAVAVAATLVGRADARDWTVGGPNADFPLIAPAIGAAAAGDVIRVRGGVYREDLLVDKRLAIRGEQQPVLFGTGVGSVITIVASGSEVSGFTIEGSGLGETNQMDAAIQVRSNGNRIVDNRMRRVFYGVVVADSMHNEIADNEIAGLRELPFGRRGDGIYLFRAPENFVARNRISGERDGIYFQYAPRGRAVDNVVSDSRYGLHDMFSDDTAIARNTFADSVVGANIMNSRRIRFASNRIRRNRGIPGIGLTLKDCDDSTIERNRIVENGRGLVLDGSSANRFSGNAFRANDTAVTLFSSAERNAFGDNEFVDNWSDVVLSGADSGTRWSIGGRGNYWTRYRGFDFDGDGLGDSSHPVVGAFERLEGRNAAARIFLHSPAAAGLEMAARLGGTLRADATDDRPIARRPPQSEDPARRRAQPAAAALIAMCLAACAAFFMRRAVPCSR
ncbi:MAG TPA: nitrous oxide reductase family maturation protein NosD [Vicinamibacterales bacterium]|nr:nitrous oxide reductase family maturation protein NosD [Vicinamibacterales bacterium]